MSINYRVLDSAGRDNALLVQVDSGQTVEKLLFDCGDNCLTELSFGEIQKIDHLFLSHLHMDHVGGFDSFFRCTFNRCTKPNVIWGPPETSRILHHRFQGFLWNLSHEMNGTWRVCDIHPDTIRTTRFELHDAFSSAHSEEPKVYSRTIYEGSGFVVEAFTMNHQTTTLAFVVREIPRLNVDLSKLKSLGLNPGPWIKQLKEPSGGSDELLVDGESYSIDELRGTLLTETPGDSIAYLTDFLLDDAAMEKLIEELSDCDTIVCESQYRQSDIELARKNYHMTTVQAATLAKRAQIGEMVLFHLSERYDQTDWLEMLAEARAIFPNTRYPEHWDLEIL